MTPPTLDDLVAELRSEAADICTGAELMGRLHRPRRHRATLIAVAAGIAAAVVVTLVFAVRHAPSRQPTASPGSPRASQSSSAPGVSRIELHAEVPAYITIPSGWSWARFAGAPATIVFPLVYISSQHLAAQCTGVARASCWNSLAFPTAWRTPREGVLVEWSEYENLTLSGHELKYVSGRRTTIAGRPAKVSRSAADGQSCPVGTSAQLVAYIAEPRELRFDVTACFGPLASQQLRVDVEAMLHSLDLGSRQHALPNASVTVPNVLGKRRADAEVALDNAGLRSEFVREGGRNAQPDTVVAQSPRAGSRVATQTVVRLTIAK